MNVLIIHFNPAFQIKELYWSQSSSKILRKKSLKTIYLSELTENIFLFECPPSCTVFKTISILFNFFFTSVLRSNPILSSSSYMTLRKMFGQNDLFPDTIKPTIKKSDRLKKKSWPWRDCASAFFQVFLKFISIYVINNGETSLKWWVTEESRLIVLIF